MNFTKIFKTLFAVLLAAVVLSSCQKENMDEIVTGDPEFTPQEVEVNNLIQGLNSGPSDGQSLECVTILYPFDLELSSGATVSVASETDFSAAMNGSDPVVDFQYPVNIINNLGQNAQVANSYDLGVSCASCVPSNGWELMTMNGDLVPAFLPASVTCYDLVYPVDLEDGDGNSYVADEEADVIDLYLTNDELYFVLPITLVDENGDEVVINESPEFFNTILQCDLVDAPVVDEGFEFTGFACNTLLFPVDILLADGTEVTVNDENEYVNLVLSEEDLQILYPFSLETFDGEVLVIADLDDLILAYEECGIIIDIGITGPCDFPAHVQLFFSAENIFSVFPCPFDINYPIQLDFNGTVYDIPDVGTYFTVTGAPGNIAGVTLIYPIDVTEEDGTVVTLNSDDDVCDFIQSCP